MPELSKQVTQEVTKKTYLSLDEAGELCVEPAAWLSTTHIPSYTLIPEAFKDNTEYAKKISSSNREPMYGSRTLTVMYSGNEKCPYLPIERVRILGVARKNSGSQAYGTNYIRVGIPEAIFENVCSKASERLNLRNPPVEKVTRQAGFCLFTVTVPKAMHVHTLTVEDGEETVVEVPDPSRVFLMGKDIIASCFFVIKAKYKGQPVTPEKAEGYSLAFEPAIITLIELCKDQLDNELAPGAPTLAMGSLVPPADRKSTRLNSSHAD